MSDQSTLGAIANEFASLLTPLRVAASDEAALVALFRRLGLQVGTAAATFSAVGDAVVEVMSLVQDLSDDPSVDDIRKAFAAIAAVHEALKQQPPPLGTTAEEFARALVELLLLDYLSARFPLLYTFFKSLGIIQRTIVPAQGGRQIYAKTTIDWDRLPKLLENPLLIAKETYSWGTSSFAFAELVSALFEFLLSLGLRAEIVYLQDQEEQYAYVDDPETSAGGAAQLLRVILMDTIIADTPVEVGVAIRELREDATGPWGIVIEPLINKTLDATLPLTETTTLTTKVSASLPDRFGIQVRPGSDALFRLPFGETAVPLSGEASFGLQIVPETPLFIFGRPGATRFEAKGGEFAIAVNLSTSAPPEVTFRAGLLNSAIVVSSQDLDGFLGSVGVSETRADLDIGLEWSTKKGFGFSGSSSFALDVPVSKSIGPVTILALHIGLRGEGTSPATLVLEPSVDFSLVLGPVTALVEKLGLRLKVKNTDGNLGPFDLGLGLGLPTGIGIAINGGSVSGGGFIKFDEPNGRYFGALELNVYEISVKAFGLIETKFPDGHKGFSFIVVISAEFTPIQLGFGFTLNGVGGLLGINRTLDEAGLLAAVKKGELENVLFPHDVVANAPHIMQDLQTIFPAAQNHYVFGPMAKLAWIGLVEGELGLILELPGPRLAILGTVRIALPTKEDALVDLQFDVSGVLDFPKKKFSLDASLAKESRVGDFPISGDMALRLTWGNNPNFALAIGGFNKHYAPPAGFPALKRMTIDLGVHGNPSINLSGYTALTSNTAQVGARLEARISQSGAELYGFVAFDALFVFSPFSFVGTLDGAVGVNFHGAGFSLQFHGQISGPSPWMISGQVCVSILFWDACVGFTLPPLGNDKKVSLPGIDPWVGSLPARPDGTQDVPGLKPALEDPRNWGGGKPAGSFAVVTLTDSATDKPPVDPLGSAIVRQKVCPLDIPITRFAGAKPPQVRNFVIESVKIGEEGQMSAPITNVPRVDDLFAPAQYTEMKDADKLSSASFVQMHAGIAVSSDALEFGPQVPKGLLYDTIVFDPVQPEQEHDKQYNPQQVNVTVASGMSATALGGIRQQGSFKFVDTTAPFKVRFVNEAYVLSSVGSLKVTGSIPLTNPVSRPAAVAALFAAGTTDPTVLRNAQVTPFYNARP